MKRLEKIEFTVEQNLQKWSSLNELQQQYLKVFIEEKTIENTVLSYLQKGWLINFVQFQKMLQFLDSQQLLKPHWSQLSALSYLSEKENTLHANSSSEIAAGVIQGWPFFRSLPPEIFKELWKQHEVVDVNSQSYILRQGEKSRDLWTLISGQAAILDESQKSVPRILGFVDPKSTFGELGFFLGTPRSAHVMTLVPSQLLKIPFSAKIESMIQGNIFQKLSYRFQVLRAFLHSPIFKNIPEPNMDELIFKGQLLTVQKNQLLFQEGDIGTSCYILIEGSIAISQKGRMINQLKQGSTLGEIALFWSQGRRTASAVAQSHGLLLEIRQNEFYRILARNLDLAVQLETLAFERGHQDQIRNRVA